MNLYVIFSGYTLFRDNIDTVFIKKEIHNLGIIAMWRTTFSFIPDIINGYIEYHEECHVEIIKVTCREILKNVPVIKRKERN